jgi:hypothetical protein
MDVAVAQENNELVWHRADCPYVRMLANRGEPVLTMLEITRPIPDDAKKHSCLEEQK